MDDLWMISHDLWIIYHIISHAEYAQYDLSKKWLVGWSSEHEFYYVTIPIDELIVFRGVETTNQMIPVQEW